MRQFWRRGDWHCKNQGNIRRARQWLWYSALRCNSISANKLKKEKKKEDVLVKELEISGTNNGDKRWCW
jgi:hypothetical protein